MNKDKEYLVRIRTGATADEFAYKNKMITRKGLILKGKEIKEIKLADKKQELEILKRG